MLLKVKSSGIWFTEFTAHSLSHSDQYLNLVNNNYWTTIQITGQQECM